MGARFGGGGGQCAPSTEAALVGCASQPDRRRTRHHHCLHKGEGLPPAKLLTSSYACSSIRPSALVAVPMGMRGGTSAALSLDADPPFMLADSSLVLSAGRLLPRQVLPPCNTAQTQRRVLGAVACAGPRLVCHQLVLAGLLSEPSPLDAAVPLPNGPAIAATTSSGSHASWWPWVATRSTSTSTVRLHYNEMHDCIADCLCSVA